MSQGRVSDVKEYWLHRGEKYLDEFHKHDFYTRRRFHRQEKTLLRTLKCFHFETVFEGGVGFGRITRLMLKEFPKVKVTGVDLSPHQIENAHKYVNSDRVTLLTGAIQDIDIPDNSFDLVIAVEFLMHIPFDEIKAVMKKLVNISKRHVVNLDWQGAKQGVEFGGYMFSHDYISIYQELGIDTIEVIPVPRSVTYEVRFGWDRGLQLGKSVGEMQKIWHAVKTA